MSTPVNGVPPRRSSFCCTFCMMSDIPRSSSPASVMICSALRPFTINTGTSSRISGERQMKPRNSSMPSSAALSPMSTFFTL